ncbi:hypothetical protein F4780DRAFT_750168 [Xylariomycetidae sp. FL0641]|nr:hypothetical protein F4780DRAFT_750168 [Xylariomycetidae sp. FL0641]
MRRQSFVGRLLWHSRQCHQCWEKRKEALAPALAFALHLGCAHLDVLGWLDVLAGQSSSAGLAIKVRTPRATRLHSPFRVSTSSHCYPAQKEAGGGFNVHLSLDRKAPPRAPSGRCFGLSRRETTNTGRQDKFAPVTDISLCSVALIPFPPWLRAPSNAGQDDKRTRGSDKRPVNAFHSPVSYRLVSCRALIVWCPVTPPVELIWPTVLHSYWWIFTLILLLRAFARVTARQARDDDDARRHCHDAPAKLFVALI